MSSSQATEQTPQRAAASHASSSSTKSSADWHKYYDLLVKRREAALKPGKSKTAAWWNFFEIVLVKDPFTSSPTNVLLKCTLCNQELSSNNTSRIAESH